jgi:2-polyprenyl-3-methyl-5-hydroxy-6-metoxy-1,4-benzoquinol methylase
MLRTLAGFLANSSLLSEGARIWEENCQNWNLPLTKYQKLVTGLYLIIRDYHNNVFPRNYQNQPQTHNAEIAYSNNLPGVSIEDFTLASMRKPFWSGDLGKKYLLHFSELVKALETCRVKPPSRILELGCGHGWMAEFLAIMGYELLATTLAEEDITAANRRIDSIKAKGLPCRLNFAQACMESVHSVVTDGEDKFDAAFVYEALHHAHDWQATFSSVFQCLKQNGSFIIMNEPNVAHTLISYRVACLSNTHEIGMNPHHMIRCLKRVGFKDVRITKNRFHFYCLPISIVAIK